MSFLGADLRAMGSGLASQVTAASTALRRITAAVALLRLLVLGSLLAASALALPAQYTLSRTVVVPVALAVIAALLPRTAAVTVALVVLAAAWLAAHQDPPLWKILALAALLYVAHAGAAFAAVIPYDCAVAPAALLRWAGRTASVVAVSLAVGAAGLLVVGAVPLPASVVGPIAGSLVAAGVAALLVWQLRRPTR